MKLAEYGNPHGAEWSQQSIGDVADILATLCERECERMESNGANTYGDGPLAVRLDLVEKARELLEVANAGNVKIMRAALASVL